MERFAANIALFRLINSNHNSVLDAFFTYFRWLGTGYVLIPVLLWLILRNRTKIKPLLIAVAVETVAVSILKRLACQPRPVLEIANVHLLQHLHLGSFPSGDAAMAFAIAAVLSRGERRITQIALFTYATLVAYERVYLGVHFPLDVVTGAVIGMLCAYLPYVRLRSNRADNETSSGASSPGTTGDQVKVEAPDT